MRRGTILGLGIGFAGLTALLASVFPREGAAWWRALTSSSQMVQAYMATNWLAFGAGQVLVAASGLLPASLIAIMAGASFGFGWGLLLSSASTMLGGWLAFLLSRSVLRRFAEHLVRRHAIMDRLDQGMTQEGWRLVMLLRVSPVMPFAMTSYALGLTGISQREFLLGTLASLPALIGYVALGALGKQGLLLSSGQATPWHWFAMCAGLLVVFYALFRLKQAMTRVASACRSPTPPPCF